jgi:hypothetical protein
MRLIRPIAAGEVAMNSAHDSNRRLLESGERFLGHMIAVVAGLVLMLVGLGLGVTMVLLPIGLPVGLGGLLLVVWGLYFAPRREGTSGTGTPGR